MGQSVLRLDVVNGSSKGQVVVVPDHATIVVGRLPECGLSIPNDLTVSRQHFQIDYHAPKCRLTHLSQTGQTYVNGNAVADIELKNGDEIVFGEGNRLSVTVEENRDGSASATAIREPSETPTSNAANSFTTSDASSGWTLYESPNEQPDFSRLFEILTSSRQMSAVIDFGRMGISVSPELTDPQYLFSWMQPPTLAQRSPVLTSVPANSAVADIVKAAWGKDGIVCFGSDLQGADLAGHWRKAIGMTGDEPGSAMTAYFWPSILNLILTCQSPEQAAPLLSGLSWLFVECPKSPGKWRLFTKDDWSVELTKSRLVAVAAPTAK